MKANELIGKKAIRTGPTCYGDYSYTTEPLLIVKVTENHILTKYPEENMFSKITKDDRPHILNKRWNDDNWTDYDELMNIAEPNTEEVISSAETDPVKIILSEMDDYCAGVCKQLDSITVSH